MSSSGLPSAKGLVDDTFQHMRAYCAAISKLPQEEYEYHSAFRGFSKTMSLHTDAMLDIMDACARQVPKRRRVVLAQRGGLTAVQRHTAVMEAVDSILENVDSLLDMAKGHKLQADDQLQVVFGSAGGPAAPGSHTGRGGMSSIHQMVKPQLAFQSDIDNSFAPFRPKIYRDDGSFEFGAAGVHPFRELLQSFTFAPSQLLPSADIPYLPLEATPLTSVDTLEGIQAMVEVLAKEKEIAVDLEHHDFHSYQGLTCLMQISTRHEDFLIDCIKIRGHMHLLNRVFLDSTILKVFHGAKEDIRWLQKDFSLYVANMFDTGIALQTLHMPHSLAFAVDHFCQVRLDKKYQLADWRIRPLPVEMAQYARQDTHFLLYCYDRLKSLLLHAEGRASVGNLLVHVLQESRRLSMTIYEKPAFDPETTYREAMGRSLGGLSPVQMEVLRAVFNWRDAAAREADESPQAVMHAAAVLQIASKLPTSARDILKCCTPVSVVVRAQVGAIVDAVRDALARSGATVDATSGEVDSHEEGSLALSHHHTRCMYSMMSGTLPSVEYRVGDEGVSICDVPSLKGMSVKKTITPSAWFQAMTAHSAALQAVPKPVVQLPGHAISARVVLRAKPVPPTAPSDAPTVDGGDAVDAEPEEFGECVMLPSSKKVSHNGSSAGVECDEEELIDATATGTAEADPEPLAALKPKPNELPLSVAEAYESGRKQRRAEVAAMQARKRNRDGTN